MKVIPIRSGLAEGWAELFIEFVDEVGFTRSGMIIKESLLSGRKELCEEGSRLFYFENEVFILSSYYIGSREKFMNFPNFKYKKTGFELSWEGSIVRGLYSDHRMDREEFKEMLLRCRLSLEG